MDATDPTLVSAEPMLVCGGSFLAMVLFFGRKAAWAAVVAAILALKFQDMAIGVMGFALFLFFLIEASGRLRPARAPRSMDDDAIDVEYEVVQ